MAICFFLGPIFSVLANSIAPLLCSNKMYFVVLLHYSVSIAMLISLNKRIIRIVSHNDMDKAKYSASDVERAISVRSFDFHAIGQSACLMINRVLENASSGSSALALSNPPAKSTSTKISNPLASSGSYAKPSSAVPNNYLPIRFTAISWHAFGSVENLVA